jgi:tyrosyl-tRNA synthetase
MLYNELKKRGLIYQETSEELAQVLENPTTFYCGVDPTSDCLHIGSLLPLITMRRLQDYGHKPILLLGGATGMIGDPSGKSKERNLLTAETIANNAEGIFADAKKILRFEGTACAAIVNNLDWMGPYSYIDFLRDVGKHFSVNAMLAKDSVKSRIENRDQGISYTEFSYMLLQSYDFYHLNKEMNCQLQIGGSDQWGNITAGVDLIRRMKGDVQDKETVFGMTFPLVTKADGSKFGKTESGNVWLDSERTSPYQFYQFFVRLPDDEVIKLLYLFSLKPLEELEALEERFKAEPHKREAQVALAEELTDLIHGHEELGKAQRATEALFSGDFSSLELPLLKDVFSDAPSIKISKLERANITLVDVLVQSGLCSSKGAARKDIKAGAVYLNNEKFTGENMEGADFPLLHESMLILRRGKKNYCLVQFL